MIDSAQRPSLADLAALAQGGGADGWACPRCACRDWRVAKTYRGGNGELRRTRICRNCGQERLLTVELPREIPAKAEQPQPPAEVAAAPALEPAAAAGLHIARVPRPRRGRKQS